jgi:hypothetical protein
MIHVYALCTGYIDILWNPSVMRDSLAALLLRCAIVAPRCSTGTTPRSGKSLRALRLR